MNNIASLVVGLPGAAGGGRPADVASLVVEAPGRTYVGNAEPVGPVAVVGGREVVVGGWSRYEAERRHARWKSNPSESVARPATRYGRRTYVAGQDVLDSLVTARVGGGRVGGGAGAAGGAASADPLEAACGRYAGALERTSVAAGPGDVVVVGGATPDDIRELAGETDLHVLHRAAEDAAIFAEVRGGAAIAVPGVPRGLPPLPTREVAVRGARPEEVDREVAALEAAVLPRAAAVEEYRGAVAGVLDGAAAALES